MYHTFFSLSAPPYSLTPDPSFLYLTPEHRDAIAGLTYSVLSRKGISVLTGNAGTGKTTLLRAVMRSISPDRAQFSFVVNPLLTPDDFFRTALCSFGITGTERHKGNILTALQAFLVTARQQERSVVLVIDEAQRLSPELLEEIRLLANFETDADKLLQILLVGQDELDELMDRHDLRQLKQRIAIRLRIHALDERQVGEYMRHRWNKVTSSPFPFDAEAIHTVRAYSNGIPRLVNAICDNALLHAFAEGSTIVTRKTTEAVARDLHLSMDTYGQRPVVAPVVETSPMAMEERAYEMAPLRSLEAYMPNKRWPFRLSMRSEGM